MRHYVFAVMGWPGRAQRPNLLDFGWEASSKAQGGACDAHISEDINPERAISGRRRGGLITVCEGMVGCTLTEREQSSHVQVEAGGASRSPSFTQKSPKPGALAAGGSLMNALPLREHFG